MEANRTHFAGTCTPVESRLYQVMGEDEMLNVYDFHVMVTLNDGRRFVHNSFTVKGASRDSDGFMCFNRNGMQVAYKFCAKVESVGSIDLSYWTEIVDVSWEDREEYNIKCEADEKNWGY